MKIEEKGFTLIELIVIIVILGLLASVAIPKFQDMTAKAEAASVKNILGATRSALSIRVASAYVDGTDVTTLDYNGSAALNPMFDLLSEKPDNYLGVVAANQTAEQAQGKWFDRNLSGSDHWMMYKFTHPEIITQVGGAAGGGWSHAGRNIIHRIEQNPDDTSSLILTTTPTYQFDWAF